MWSVFRRESQYLANAADVVFAADIVRWHFHPLPSDQLTITGRTFPFRMRADLQRALDRLVNDAEVRYFAGARKTYEIESIRFADCLVRREHDDAICIPPEFEEIDIGDAEPVRCLKTGLWLIDREGQKFALLIGHAGYHGMITGLRVEVAAPNTPAGTELTRSFFRQLEQAVERAESYRGKVLSLEANEHSYRGTATGVKVHRLHTVERNQVILPRSTLDLLERNVIDFVHRRPMLARQRLATKKGLLFYGPPGTGKTHTIHYLARALEGHTTLIITAEQIGLLDEYMTLGRLLQPSVIVIEDVDLIGRERSQMQSVCEEVLLNKLLNQMDGLKEDADILFILTTNRPEMLEPALAARPGRIDQAIEFPLPDEEGRAKLVQLYAAGIDVPDELVTAIVKRTEGVSAAFIKELMRRAYQFQLERDGDSGATLNDVEAALDEMLFRGGALNRVLLGATAHPAHAS